MIPQSSKKIDIRSLKSFVRERLPRSYVLRKILLTEVDEMGATEFIAKIDIWLFP